MPMKRVRCAAAVAGLMLCMTHAAACSSARPEGGLSQRTLPPPTANVREVNNVLDFAPRWKIYPATVFLFIAPECPISNAYAAEIGRVVESYRSRVGFFVVHADPRVTEDAARRHAREFGLHCRVLLDPRQELARSVGATVTPEAALLDRGGKVVYLGRIDDRFYGFGKQRKSATTHELRDALDAVLAGRPVANAAEPAIGCEIPPPLSSGDGRDVNAKTPRPPS